MYRGKTAGTQTRDVPVVQKCAKTKLWVVSVNITWCMLLIQFLFHQIPACCTESGVCPCSSSSLSVKITWSNLSALLISSVSKVNVSRVYWKTYRSERWRLCSRLSGAVMGTIRCLKSFEPSYPPPTTSICCWRTFGFLWSAPHMSHVAASVHSPSSARLALHFDCVFTHRQNTM